MKRLTERYEENGVQIKDAGQYPPLVGETLVCHRLADIEDILCDGTDEYDLDRLRVIISQCMTMREEVAQRFSLTAKIPLDRLEELVQAYKEGISPCTFCGFNPPSSGDGKPCCICPAEAAI